MLLFSKMQGTGNDFIIINCLNQYFNYNLNTLAKYLCNRNFGIGADGVIYLFRGNNNNFKMRIFNSDGTEAEMCGNGIRCLGKYMYEKNIITKTEFDIETLAGKKEIKLIVQNRSVIGVKVNMGFPMFEAERLPVYLPKEERKKEFHSVVIKIDDIKYTFNLVSIGNPHAVCFLDNLAEENICKIRTNSRKL